MPNVVSQGNSIPWPGGVGTTGTIDLHNLMSGIAGAQANRTPSGYSGAYLSLKNDTDSTLQMSWDVSKTSFILVAGEPLTIPIRQQDTKLNWVVTQQNVAQYHTAEMLYSTFIDPTDVAAGYPITGGSSVNPSIPAAAIGPGALPEGVTIEADDVGVGPINETFGAFAFINPGQVNAGALTVGVTIDAGDITAGTLIAAVHLTSINSDGGKITSDGAGNLTIASGGAVNTPRVNYQGTLSASNKIQDLQQGYQYFSDNTATFGTTRNWLDGPDRGEFQLGPRTGSNYFDWIRMRATHFTFDIGKNASTNTEQVTITGATVGDNTPLIVVDDTPPTTQHADFLQLKRLTNQPHTFTIGIDGSDNLYIYDTTNAAFALAGTNSTKPILVGNSAGGGATGNTQWTCTTDPGGSAGEGDTWAKA